MSKLLHYPRTGWYLAFLFGGGFVLHVFGVLA